MDLDPLALIGVALLGGLYMLVNARGEGIVARRRIKSARGWTIGDMPDGVLGRIAGRVRPLGEPLRSPLTNRACVCFVAEVASDFVPGTYREVRAIPFVIEDETGAAIVDPTGANLDVPLEMTGACGRAVATPAEAAMFARRRRGPTLRLEDWTFREGVIEAGAMVAVLGTGDREPDPSAPIDGADVYREMPTRLRLVAKRGYPLAISRS
jgi:hypothetical protein